VGINFVSQNPLDIPDQILGQLGNRIQHALRAFTPRDQKAVRAAAETFRPNPAFDSAKVITELAVGEGLVSFLEGNGVPGIVQRALIRPPSSRIGSITFDERQEVVRRSPQRGKYDQIIDRDSAYEQLAARAAKATQSSQPPAETQPSQPKGTGGWGLPEVLTGTSRRQGILEAMAKSVARTVGSQIGREIVRGVLGSIFRGK
jgi:DNA helicase HerA-like ATPase